MTTPLGHNIVWRSFPAARRMCHGFTLGELLAALAIGGLLVALGSAFAARSFQNARGLRCLEQMRTLGSGIRLYAQDNDANFPRSIHSGGEWSISILPYLGYRENLSDGESLGRFNSSFRCPAHKSSNSYIWSYGINVFFELDAGDGYEGKPATWHKLINIERPGSTILLGELKGTTANLDHFMCHQWSSTATAKSAIAHDRHLKKSNYLFVDGHAESLSVEASFNPTKNINKWHPAKAW